jgi:hypothetical protein
MAGEFSNRVVHFETHSGNVILPLSRSTKRGEGEVPYQNTPDASKRLPFLLKKKRAKPLQKATKVEKYTKQCGKTLITKCDQMKCTKQVPGII